jgi:hypothetical protein
MDEAVDRASGEAAPQTREQLEETLHELEDGCGPRGLLE